MNFGTFIKQQHCAQVSNANVGEALLLAAHQFDAFHLSVVRLIAEHVNVQQLGHVSVEKCGKVELKLNLIIIFFLPFFILLVIYGLNKPRNSSIFKFMINACAA